MFGIVGLGAVNPRKSAMEKKVEAVNEMIKEANKKGIYVVDTSSTWEAPMMYEPLKYSRKQLFVKYKQLDLYRWNRGGGEKWNSRTERWGGDDVKDIVNYVAKMYRKALKQY